MAPSNRNLYIAAGTACLTGALFGYSVGFIGGILVLPSFLHQFGLDSLSSAELASSRSTIVTLWLAGALLGVPLSMPLCARYGRKLSLQFTSILAVFGAFLQLASFGDFGLFVVGRFLNGIAAGAASLVSNIYISEISPPSERGMLMSGSQALVHISALGGFWGAYIAHAMFPSTSVFQWALPVMVQLLPGTFLLLGTFFICESPRYHASKNQFDEAEEALAWLRRLPRGHPDLSEELYEMQEDAEEACDDVPCRSLLSELKKKDVRKRLGLGLGLMVAQNMAGQNALNFFAPIIFISAGFTSVSTSLLLTGFFSVVRVLSAILFMFVFVRIKSNRFWLKLGLSGCAVCMLVLANYIRTCSPASSIDQLSHSPAAAHLTIGAVVPVLMVYGFSFFFTISIGPISWNITSEIFPVHINAQCCAITTCMHWILQIVTAYVTPRLIAAVGWQTYLFYAGFCIAGVLWVWGYVPETRGVRLGKPMDEIFGVYDSSSEEDGDMDKEAMEVLVVERVPAETTPLLNGNRARRGSFASFA